LSSRAGRTDASNKESDKAKENSRSSRIGGMSPLGGEPAVVLEKEERIKRMKVRVEKGREMG